MNLTVEPHITRKLVKEKLNQWVWMWRLFLTLKTWPKRVNI